VTVDAHPRLGDDGSEREGSGDDSAGGDRGGCAGRRFAEAGTCEPAAGADGGVLVRAGQTEGSVDLAQLAGLKPSAVICEIMRDDGEMARRPELEAFCATHKLKMCTIAELISYRLKREQFVKRIER